MARLADSAVRMTRRPARSPVSLDRSFASGRRARVPRLFRQMLSRRRGCVCVPFCDNQKRTTGRDGALGRRFWHPSSVEHDEQSSAV